MIERIPPRLLDIVVAAVVTLLTGGTALAGDRHPLVVAGAIAACAVLVVRRHRPLLVLVLVTAAAFALALAGSELLALGLAVAFFSVGAHAQRRSSLSAAAAALAVVAVGFVVDRSNGPGSSVPMLMILAVSWVLGDNARARNVRNAERSRDAVAQERARIARELHDVVAHNVSVMVIQAAAANEVLAQRPERAREALRAVEQTGRRALGELRRLLDVVADDERDGTLPQPGLARLDELVERVRAAGPAVDVTVEGTARELPSGIDLSAFRIVQEALTNTLKHARATRVGVVVRYLRDTLELEITDDGVGGSPSSAGRGLVGMRERATLFGGELHAGAEPGGGFAVRARLPVEP